MITRDNQRPNPPHSGMMRPWRFRCVGRSNASARTAMRAAKGVKNTVKTNDPMTKNRPNGHVIMAELPRLSLESADQLDALFVAPALKGRFQPGFDNVASHALPD